MKLVLLAVVCLAVVCVVEGQARFTDSEYQTAFLNWQRQFGRSFTADEFLTRFANFKTTFDFVSTHNSKGLSWTAGLNEFSHLTPAEFQRIYLFDISQFPFDRTNEYTGEGGRTSRAASVTVDWRNTTGVVGPVKNQGQCGSCWTFGATGAIESAWAIKTKKSVVLSEQQLLDCTPRQLGCNGGNPQAAINYITSAGGQQSNASYPYAGKNGTCKANSAYFAATVSSSTAVSRGSESALQSAVNNQPVVVAIDANGIQSYRSGVFDDTACTTTLNHAVIAVGYGNDGSKDYWIIRNSWGKSWGEQGYFRLAKGVNRCGVANQAVFPTTSGTGNKI